MKFKGKAWTFGRNVYRPDFPKTWFKPTYTPAMASHLMVGIGEDTPQGRARRHHRPEGRKLRLEPREEAAAAMKRRALPRWWHRLSGRLFTAMPSTSACDRDLHRIDEQNTAGT
jgi:hypothetical protein